MPYFFTFFIIRFAEYHFFANFVAYKLNCYEK